MIKKEATIEEKNGELTITIPQQLNVIRVIILVFTGIPILGLLAVMAAGNVYLAPWLILLFSVSLLVLFFYNLKELFWQIFGKSILRIVKNDFVFEKNAPLTKSMTHYNTQELMVFDEENIATQNGQVSFLNLLHVTKDVNLALAYNYGTLAQLSGLDETQIAEIVRLLNQRIKNRFPATTSKLAVA